MNKYFDIFLEFDQKNIIKIIENHISNKNKGYICIVDAVVLSFAVNNYDYKRILNHSILNVCDGSSIALLTSWLYKQDFKSYPGPDLFCDYIKSGYRQCFLGNTEEVLVALQSKMSNLGLDVESCKFVSLPFCEVDKFDYEKIAFNINNFKPDIIWVSLGAPKQELFISKLYPHIHQGLLFAIGAAVNFYVGGKIKRAPLWMQKNHIEWLFRLFSEPNKQIKRLGLIFRTYPKMIFQELI